MKEKKKKNFFSRKLNFTKSKERSKSENVLHEPKGDDDDDRDDGDDDDQGDGDDDDRDDGDDGSNVMMMMIMGLWFRW